MAAHHARRVDRIYVSTDDDDIMNLAQPFNAEIIQRPPELATKEALGEDAFIHASQTIKNNTAATTGDVIEMLVLLMANAATILADTIDEGIEKMRQNKHLDSAVTVSCYNMWSPLRARRINADGDLQPFVPFETFGNPKTLNCDRDSQGDVWFADMGVSIVRPRCLEEIDAGLLPQKWMGKKIHSLKQWGGCDIDFEWQVPLVEFWLRKYGFTENKTPYNK